MAEEEDKVEAPAEPPPAEPPPAEPPAEPPPAEPPAEPTRWAQPKEPASELTAEAAEEAKFLRSAEREQVHALAGRARFVAVVSFIVGSLALALGFVSLVKRADAINVIYMLVSAGLNAALGVFLMRASRSFQGLRRAPEAPILDGFSQLSKAFVVQLLIAGLVALGLVVTLLLAIISNRALNQ
jgi:hypothetical protein